MACGCQSGSTSGSYSVKLADGTITTWRTQTEAEAAAARTGGTVIAR